MMTIQSSLRVFSIAAVVTGSLACSGRPAPVQAAAAATPDLAIAHGAATPPPATHALPVAAPEAGQAVPLPKASGTTKVMTIADVWKNRETLAGKTVTVRGKIVKYNGGILGVNWMHLQDGSGSAPDGSNDLAITSEADSKVGDEVEATGILAVNRDIGSGYRYGAIIERAQLARP